MSPTRLTSQQKGTPLRAVIPSEARDLFSLRVFSLQRAAIPPHLGLALTFIAQSFLFFLFRRSELQLRHQAPKTKWALAPEDNSLRRKRILLRFAQRGVQIIRSFEFLFEFFARQIRAQVINRLRHAVERMRNVVLVRQHDIAPKPVRASGNPQQIFQAGTRERKRQARFIRFVLHHLSERNRNKLRQVRNNSHGPVVRFRVAPDGLCANRANDLRESAHAVVGIIFRADQSVRSAAKQFRIRAVNSGLFFSRHWVAAKKSRAGREFRIRGAADHVLRAARVGDEGFCTTMRGNLGERFDRRAHGKRDVNEIRAVHRIAERGGSLLHRAEWKCALEYVRAIKSDERERREVAAQCESKRAADQARADNRYAVKGNCARHCHATMLNDERLETKLHVNYFEPFAAVEDSGLSHDICLRSSSPTFSMGWFLSLSSSFE